ncbi:MAG: D-glycero-beta-D-manno-heptose-7-phosphate kinase [Acidobacteria bacterium]|nr:D-glycero-beta-D-manno-heptose-7-phosphate kinase [Acidobacteriota bacterium]
MNELKADRFDPMTPAISYRKIELIIKRFPRQRLLVIGDIMLDQFIWGTASRISPEAPVPVVRIERETVHLGGAGNVVHNLVSLGAQARPFGIIGGDEAGERLVKAMHNLGVDTSGLLKDASRPTTLKTRIIAHNQQVVRADRESRQPVSQELTDRLAALVANGLSQSDGLIVSDYDKGGITPPLLQQILPLARQAGKPIFIDPKIRNFKYYSPVTMLKPNQRETENVTQIEITNEETLVEAGRAILRLLRCEHLLITRGEAGMTLFSGTDQIAHIPAATREVYDVTGAGDTAMATLGLAFASGATALEAAILANYAASVAIAKVGTATVSQEELLKAIADCGLQIAD